MNTSQSSQTFEFTEINQIYSALLSLRRPILPSNAKITHDHLQPLKQLDRDLKTGAQALENAYKLGTGYDDLAVILLEPSDKAETHGFDEMFNASMALRTIDSSLRHAFVGQRDIQNTVILDIRALRSDSIRRTQRSSDKLGADELAYIAFEQILCHLKPDVILVCQCQTITDEVKNQFARRVCSSIDEATDISVLRLPRIQHELVIIKSFHPMYLEYMRGTPNDSATKAVLREYLFDAGFIIASNALAGRRITGTGLHNLRACARDGPVFIATHKGVRISYQWFDKSDFADNELVEKLEMMGIFSEDENERRLDRILSLFQILSKRVSGLGDYNAVEDKECQKYDVLEKLGPIPQLPQGIIPW